MHPYQSSNHDTGVIAYQNGADHIAVQFKDSSVYLIHQQERGPGFYQPNEKTGIGRSGAHHLHQSVCKRSLRG